MILSRWRGILGLAGLFAIMPAVQAQQRPYIGFAYPAGGRQGSTFQVTFGGQYLEGITNVFVSGSGVHVKVLEYNKHLNPQEIMLLREQLDDLKKGSRQDQETKTLIARIEKRIREYVLRTASVSIANIVIAEVTIASDAKPNEREIMLGTTHGVSNPMVFHVGQLPEYTKKPMTTSPQQVLGKEEDAIRRTKRPEDTEEVRIPVPSIVNGQISNGAIHRYRFEAKKGQHLVITALARQLVPYIADAVPGWFQAVLAVYDSKGKELAYDDDYRFKPDPVIYREIPADGEYVFAIYDSIYRGREDFVYRVTIGELPFVTSIFPLGVRVNSQAAIDIKGWNLPAAQLTPDTKDVEPGIYPIAVRKGGFYSNRLLLAYDTLAETLEKEPNNTRETAHHVILPIIINGRIDKPGDVDVFTFDGKAGDTIVAEVFARRLDSPVDSFLKLTDATGKQLAFNDDNEDKGSGINTHHADSYLTSTLPSDGAYYVHIRDTQHNGGDIYAYRLRISKPQPDFALRVVPSSVGLRSGASAPLSVYVLRKDGFTGDVALELKDAPKGFSLYGATLSGTNEMVQVTLRTDLDDSDGPVSLSITGRSTINGQEVVHEAVPAEDKMQAFLWRHLVPTKELRAIVFDPDKMPAPKRRRVASKP